MRTFGLAAFWPEYDELSEIGTLGEFGMLAPLASGAFVKTAVAVSPSLKFDPQ